MQKVNEQLIIIDFCFTNEMASSTYKRKFMQNVSNAGASEWRG